jgi:hypothetical protein
MWGIPRGVVIGKVDGDSPLSEAEHFWEMRILRWLF